MKKWYSNEALLYSQELLWEGEREPGLCHELHDHDVPAQAGVEAVGLHFR